MRDPLGFAKADRELIRMFKLTLKKVNVKPGDAFTVYMQHVVITQGSELLEEKANNLISEALTLKEEIKKIRESKASNEYTEDFINSVDRELSPFNDKGGRNYHTATSLLFVISKLSEKFLLEPTRVKSCLIERVNLLYNDEAEKSRLLALIKNSNVDMAKV